MADRLSRRTFLKISAATAVGMAAGGAPCRSQGSRPDGTPHRPGMPPAGIAPLRINADTDALPALVRRYPWLRYGSSPAGRLQIAPVGALAGAPAAMRGVGTPGERVFIPAPGVRILPWAPLFCRPSPLIEADGTIKRLAGTDRLFIKDEGSMETLLYGNKIRKYEFLLPNLAGSGVQTLRTHGAFGSNHCTYLTLAARFGRYRPEGAPGGLEVEPILYPQPLTEHVVTKLRLLVASGARLRFLDGDAAVGLSILREELRERCGIADGTAYVPPGGSSPLAVLGHVEAVMELAEQIASGDGPLDAPPDYIFVPLGSGATAMGLVLGCELLGWPTTVVGTCSQDKGRFVRFVVNGDAELPFSVGHAATLLEGGLAWLRALGLPGTTPLPSRHRLLRNRFAWDSESWRPAYGRVTPEIAREAAVAAGCGLVLDTTFTAKAFHTLRSWGEQGRLAGKSALLWNSYQRFPLERLLPDDPGWTAALPEPLGERIDRYLATEQGRCA